MAARARLAVWTAALLPALATVAAGAAPPAPPAPPGNGLAAALDALAADASEPLWAAWQVPQVPGSGFLCCDSATRLACRLEDRHQGWTTGGDAAPWQSEALVVLVRLERGGATRVRAFSAGCLLDPGDRRLVRLGEIEAAESVAWLDGQAPSAAHLEDGALAALAFHAGSLADAVLTRRAASGSRRGRESAVFWLGEARRRAGFLALERLLGPGSEPWLRQKIPFALSLNSEAQAGARLAGLAREDHDSDVRREALFWLAQRGDAGAAAVIHEPVERDPSAPVRSHAVFALSQLPDGQATTALLRVLRQGREPEVRRQALFWLAQSRDPEATEFLERLLLGPRP